MLDIPWCAIVGAVVASFGRGRRLDVGDSSPELHPAMYVYLDERKEYPSCIDSHRLWTARRYMSILEVLTDWFNPPSLYTSKSRS